MGKSLQLCSHKIKPIEEIEEILETDRKIGIKIVHCHGVFDLLHPGHIRHFKAAKTLGDKLVVTVTPDKFVNKGPGRPVFTESLRLESIAALECVDYVVLNNSPDAVSAIQAIKPALYVKGKEYEDQAADVTGKISEEINAVHAVGGDISYTNDIVFSSSHLLNRYFDQTSPEVKKYMEKLKGLYSLDELIDKIHGLSKLRVLIIGDAIIDEYQFTESLGQTGKGQHLVAKCLEKEVFLGGSLIIANHVAQFAGEVTLLTSLGKKCPYLNFIQQNLDKKVSSQFLYLKETASLVKKRYVMKDGKTLTKLFETYSGQEELITQQQSQSVVNYLRAHASNFDLVLACDFGNGFTNPQIIEAICDMPNFLALNAQTNSGNRGFNVVTNYRRADYISVNEPEIRLSAHNKNSSLEALATDIGQIMSCENIAITRGVKGVFFFSPEQTIEIPPFIDHAIDRIGAGDSYLSLSSLCMAMKYPPILSGFIGSVAAALSVQMIGNQEAIKKSALCKFVTRLMK